MYNRQSNVSLIKIMCLSSILFNNIAVSNAHLSEGSSCSLNDGSAGVCTMHQNCEFWKKKMQNRDFPKGSDVCGYKNLDPIVCCPKQQPIEENVIWPGNETDKSKLKKGSPCTMETDGSMGVCTAIQNCEYRIKEVRHGIRRNTTAGRCSFHDSTEIVCCPSEKPATNLKIEVRPAEKACSEYQDFVDKEEDRNGTDIQSKIFGGELAEIGQFPFMVALAYRIDPNNPSNISYICGGSLITNQHVLTAAHCASNINEYVPFEVQIGSTRLNRDDPDTQKILIKHIELHPKYKRSANYYDIAVITLSRSVTFVINKTMPICLQTVPLHAMKNLLEHQLITSGWGVTDDDGNTSDDLRYTRKLTLIDKKTCTDEYKNFDKLQRGVDDSMLCILDTNPDNRSDACQGDSGGPLFLRQEGVNTVVGVVSFGQGCATRIPSIYSSVIYHLDWIEKQVWPAESR